MAGLRHSFSETVRFRAPAGFSEALVRAAEQDGSTGSEFSRRAVVEKLRAYGVPISLQAKAEQASSDDVFSTSDDARG